MPYIADQVGRFIPGIVYTSTGSQFHATGEDAISTTIILDPDDYSVAEIPPGWEQFRDDNDAYWAYLTPIPSDMENRMHDKGGDFALVHVIHPDWSTRFGRTILRRV